MAGFSFIQLFQITALTQEAESHSGVDNIVMYLAFSASARQITSYKEGVLLPFPLF